MVDLSSGVAVCVAGEPRSFALPCTHRTMRARLLEPLAAALPNRVTVLLLLRPNATRIPWTKGSSASRSEDALRWLGKPSTAIQQHELPSLNRALQHVRGTRGLESVHVDDAPSTRGPCSELRQPCTVTGAASPTTEAFLSQQATWEACLSAVERLEARRGARFDRIVRTRPDLWWMESSSSFAEALVRGTPNDVRVPVRYDRYRRDCEARPPAAVSKPYLYLSDWLVAVPRANAHHALGWLRDFCSQCVQTGAYSLEPPPPQQLVTAEGLLAQRLAGVIAANGSSLMPLHATIVRAWDGGRSTAASRTDVLAMSQFARWAGVSCDTLDRECFGGRLRRTGLGFCTEASGWRLARKTDEACARRAKGLDVQVSTWDSTLSRVESVLSGARSS